MSRRLMHYRRFRRETVDDTQQAIQEAHRPGSNRRTVPKKSTSKPIRLEKALRLAQALHRRKA